MSIKEAYKTALTTMTIDELMDELEAAACNNRFGSHNEQRAIIRSEIRLRTA
jgi:hypothetical protein